MTETVICIYKMCLGSHQKTYRLNPNTNKSYSYMSHTHVHAYSLICTSTTVCWYLASNIIVIMLQFTYCTGT